MGHCYYYSLHLAGGYPRRFCYNHNVLAAVLSDLRQVFLPYLGNLEFPKGYWIQQKVSVEMAETFWVY